MAPVSVKVEMESPKQEDELISPKNIPGTSNLLYQSGNVGRLEVPVPFLLRNDVFQNFNKPNYGWTTSDSKGVQNNLEPTEPMILLVKLPDKVRKPNLNLVTEEEDPGFPLKNGVKVEGNYSIGGCPLECPFDLNEDFDEALVIDDLPTLFAPLQIPNKFEPLSINDGKWAIRQISTQIEPFTQEINLQKGTDGWPDKNSPVFAFVDGSVDNSGLYFTGFRGKWESLQVHCMGKYPPNAEILKMKSFRQYHDWNLGVENKPVTSTAHSIYEKLHGEFPSRGKVFLEFVYNSPTDMFDLPPEDTLCKIAIKPLPGDANPSLKSLWEEIEDLERWMTVYANFVQNPTTSDVGSFMNSTIAEFNESNASENVKATQDLLNQDPAIDLHRASSSEYSDSLDMVLQRVVKLERADCDFTDRLWSVVRRCKNTEELLECLQLVFKAVTNKMYRPYLLLNNETEMAKTLTKTMKGELGKILEMRRLDVMVKSVIECGLTKLFKDYNFSLAMSHLIERGDLDRFSPSLFKDLTDSLENIKRLHCVLEVICLSRERLTLSVNSQASHVSKLLKGFGSNPVALTWNQTYHFSVLPSEIRRLMSGLHPIYYKVKMESQTFFKWATTTIVVSPENYVKFRNHSSINDVHAREYFVYVYTQDGRVGENQN